MDWAANLLSVGCSAGSSEGGARHDAAGSGGGAGRGRADSDENQKNAEGSPCQDLCYALGCRFQVNTQQIVHKSTNVHYICVYFT